MADRSHFQISMENDDLESQTKAIDVVTGWLRGAEVSENELKWHVNEIVSFSREVIGHYPEHGPPVVREDKVSETVTVVEVAGQSCLVVIECDDRFGVGFVLETMRMVLPGAAIPADWLQILEAQGDPT